MNQRTALMIGGGIVSCVGRGQPFRAARLGRVPYLSTAKPVDLRPVRPLLDPLGASSPDSAVKIEGFALRLVAAFFLAVAFLTGLGVQHISHVRAKNEIARQLREKEFELRAVSHAYWTLAAEKAVATGSPICLAERNDECNSEVRDPKSERSPKSEVRSPSSSRRALIGRGERVDGERRGNVANGGSGKVRLAGGRSQLAETGNVLRQRGDRS